MKNCLFFAIMAFAFIMQSCSDLPEENGDLGAGSLGNGDPTKVEEKKVGYLCDVEWTEDYEWWQYKFEDEKSIGTDKFKAPWCLIPYGKTEHYSFDFTVDKREKHYACRNYYNYNYRIQGESSKSVSTESNDRSMQCVALNPGKDIYVIADGTALGSLNFVNDKLYHVIEMGGVYSIEGHLNLKFVKPVQLDVLITVFHNMGKTNGNKSINENTVRPYFRDYLAKVGYTLNIGIMDIDFPNGPNNNYNKYDNNRNGILGIPNESSMIRNSLASEYNFDYLIGLTPVNENETGFVDKIYDWNYTNINVEGFILTSQDFFGYDTKGKGRQLAALLYSKILGEDPLSSSQDRDWISRYYPTPKLDDLSQPSKYWERGRGSPSTFMYQLEFASAMQYFNFKGE